MRIGVVGAGFGGCASALALARDGHEVSLLEAVERPQPVGAGIMLQPSGMLALSRLGVLDAVLSHGEPCMRLRCVTRGERTLFNLAYAARDARLYGLGLHRGALFSALFDALPQAGVKLVLGVTACEVESEYVRDTSGVRHGPFDLVVVADGARSRLRTALGHAQRDEEYPWGAFWFVARDEARAFRHELFQAVDGAHTMLGLLPTGTRPGDSTPRVSLFSSVRLDRVAAVRARGLAAFKDEARRLTPRAEPVLAQIESFEQLLVAPYRDVRMARLDHGNVVYVGDAAHAMSPQLGQGSNLALLDALGLSDALRLKRPLADRLVAYSAARRAQLAYYQRVNRLLTPFFQGDSRLLGQLRDLIMPLAARLPFFRTQMVATMCGIKQGFVRRSLALSAELLSAMARAPRQD
jgi:2-polyprenyl-6-methoxyphenol hydroxylase-like FAD-dependent oxidoreductase